MSIDKQELDRYITRDDDYGFDRVAAAAEVYGFSFNDPDMQRAWEESLTQVPAWNPEDLARCANALERIAETLGKEEKRREAALEKRPYYLGEMRNG